MSTSPVKLSYTIPRRSDSAFQRVFSPTRPVIRLSARINLALQSSTLSSNSYFSFKVLLKLDCFASSLSTTAFNSACLISSLALITAASASATFNYSCLGFTILLILKYFSIANTHLAIFPAGSDTLVIFSIVKSSWVMSGWILSISSWVISSLGYS